MSNDAITQHAQANNVTFGKVAKYALLPAFLPRLKNIADHFLQFTFMFTRIFGTIGLIERNHPCLMYQNIGRYRFVDIVGLAASNIRFDRKGIPQAVMFVVTILTFLATVGMLFWLIASLFITTSNAYAQFFSEPSEYGYKAGEDWALHFMYRVLGEQSMYPNADGLNPWFTALFMGMLKHYSFAMLIVAAFMVLYLLVITATEAARTGKPFGTRFDGIWAPVRLAMAIGLLIPISGQGLNTAQLIVIQSAVWGSNLATNAWHSAINNMGANGPKFFEAVQPDPGYRFVRDIFLVNSCIAAVNYLSEKDGTKYGGGDMKVYRSMPKDNIVLSFGTRKAPDFCGQVTLKTWPENVPGPKTSSWPNMMATAYMDIADKFLPLKDAKNKITKLNFTPEKAEIPATMKPFMNGVVPLVKVDEYSYADSADSVGGAAKLMEWFNIYRSNLGDESSSGDIGPLFQRDEFRSALADYNQWMMDSLIQDAKYGWTTAGVFYLRLSSALSTISNVTDAAPRVTMLPSNFSKPFATPNNPRATIEEMETYCSGWLARNVLSRGRCSKLEMALKVNKFMTAGSEWFRAAVVNEDRYFTAVGGETYNRMLELPDLSSPTNVTTNAVLQPVTDHLFEDFKIHSTLNPLGAVISMGNTLILTGITAFGLSRAPFIGEYARMVGMVTFLPGFILMFWVPMLPFLYFTFAVIEWIVSIVEAIIGMPLWATTLISLDGDGLGKGIEGVKLIFELVLRPTIIVIALITSIIVFGASVQFLNKALSLYANAHDAGVTDSLLQNIAASLGMVLVYAFSIYMVATSCFKLIDAIPNETSKRWAGIGPGFGASIKMGISGISTMQGLLTGGVLAKTLAGFFGKK